MNSSETKLRGLVEEKLNEPTTCYGHCEQQSRLKFIGDGELTGVFACPSGYVSRIVRYGDEINVSKFKSFLENAVESRLEIQSEDIRTASRYSWDLGIESGKERILREAYWTQNYRRTKSGDPDRSALFLCTNCNENFLVQPVTSKSSLCERCHKV
jgi:hypothetical protein